MKDNEDIPLVLGCPFCNGEAAILRMPGDRPQWTIGCDHDEEYSCILGFYMRHNPMIFYSIDDAKTSWYYRDKGYCDDAWDDMKIKYEQT